MTERNPPRTAGKFGCTCPYGPWIESQLQEDGTTRYWCRGCGIKIVFVVESRRARG